MTTHTEQRMKEIDHEIDNLRLEQKLLRHKLLQESGKCQVSGVPYPVEVEAFRKDNEGRN